MKKIFFLLMMFVLSFSVYGFGITDEIAVNLINQEPQYAYAGDYVTVRLSLENLMNSITKPITIEFVESYPFFKIPLENYSSNIGSLGEFQGYGGSSEQVVVKFKVRVDKDASYGSYDFVIRYYETGNEQKTIQESFKVDIKANEVIQLINVDKNILIPGEKTNIIFTINNVGNSAITHLTFSWVEQNDKILPVGSDNTKYIEYIAPKKQESISFDVVADTNLNSGLYNLDITMNYLDIVSGNEKEIISTTGIFVTDNGDSQKIEITAVDSKTILPGKICQLTFNIKNLCDEKIEDIKFYWINSDKVILPIGGDNLRYIQKLDASEEIQITYNVIADANTVQGLYQLELYLEYSNKITKEKITKNSVSGIYIGGETDFDIFLSDSSGTDYSFTITNVGNNPSYSTIISIPNQPSISINGVNSYMLGNLNKGDYTQATFSITKTQTILVNTSINNKQEPSQMQKEVSQTQRYNKNNNLTSQNKITIEIIYTDSLGNRNTLKKQISLNQEKQTQSLTQTQSSNNFQRTNTFQSSKNTQNIFQRYWIYFAIVIVFGCFGFWYYKKKRKINIE